MSNETATPPASEPEAVRCPVCDLPMVAESLDEEQDDEKVCVRHKPRCTNEAHAVDWRARYLATHAAYMKLDEQIGERDGDNLWLVLRLQRAMEVLLRLKRERDERTAERDKLREGLRRILWNDVADKSQCTCEPQDQCPLCQAAVALGFANWEACWTSLAAGNDGEPRHA